MSYVMLCFMFVCLVFIVSSVCVSIVFWYQYTFEIFALKSKLRYALVHLFRASLREILRLIEKKILRYWLRVYTINQLDTLDERDGRYHPETL